MQWIKLEDSEYFSGRNPVVHTGIYWAGQVSDRDGGMLPSEVRTDTSRLVLNVQLYFTLRNVFTGEARVKNCQRVCPKRRYRQYRKLYNNAVKIQSKNETVA